LVAVKDVLGWVVGTKAGTLLTQQARCSGRARKKATADVAFVVQQL
jgi:hypothetical protein